VNDDPMQDREPAGDGPPKRGRGRPRREGIDDELLALALTVLRERGYRDFTVDAVAQRSGIAKTSIYRRWPTKGALVAAAIAPRVTMPETDDPCALLEAMRALFAGELGPTIAALAADGIDVIGRDAFRRAGAGELTIDLLTGPLWTRLLVTHEPFDASLPARIVEALR
jgi:AcrR family transcriptional regulator